MRTCMLISDLIMQAAVHFVQIVPRSTYILYLACLHMGNYVKCMDCFMP